MAYAEFLLTDYYCESVPRADPKPESLEECNYWAKQCGAPYGEFWAISELQYVRDPIEPEGYEPSRSYYPPNYEDRDSSWILSYPPGGSWINGYFPGCEHVYFWDFFVFTAVPYEDEGYHILKGHVKEYDYWKEVEGNFIPYVPGISEIPFILFLWMLLLGGELPKR